MDLPEVQAELIDRPLFALGARGVEAGDENVLETDLVELHGLLAGLADGQIGLFQVLATGRGDEELRRGGARGCHEGEILELRLACPAAAADRNSPQFEGERP